MFVGLHLSLLEHSLTPVKIVLHPCEAVSVIFV